MIADYEIYFPEMWICPEREKVLRTETELKLFKNEYSLWLTRQYSSNMGQLR